MQKKQLSLFLACLSVSHGAIAAKTAIFNCPKAEEIKIYNSPAAATGGWQGTFNPASPSNMTVEAIPIGGTIGKLTCRYSQDMKVIGELTGDSGQYSSCQVTAKKDGYICS